MPSLEQISKALNKSRDIPDAQRQTLETQLYELNKIAKLSKEQHELDDILKLSRRFNSTIYLMEFAMVYVEDEEMHSMLTGAENMIAEHLVEKLIQAAEKNQIRLVEHGASFETMHLAELVAEYDNLMYSGRRAA